MTLRYFEDSSIFLSPVGYENALLHYEIFVLDHSSVLKAYTVSLAANSQFPVAANC